MIQRRSDPISVKFWGLINAEQLAKLRIYSQRGKNCRDDLHILNGILEGGGGFSCRFQVRTTAEISSPQGGAQAHKHGAAFPRSIPGTHKGCSSSYHIPPHPAPGTHTDR